MPIRVVMIDDDADFLWLIRFSLQLEHDITVIGETDDGETELRLNRLGVSILRVLNDEHHEERDDHSRGVDDELPGVGIVVSGAKCRLSCCTIGALRCTVHGALPCGSRV